MTLALRGEIDYGEGIGGNAYPVFKNFYAGGIGSVRGYESSTLGVVDPRYGDAIGGSKRVIGNASNCSSRSRAMQGPQPALVHLRRRRPGVPGEVEDLPWRAALLGRYRPVAGFRLSVRCAELWLSP